MDSHYGARVSDRSFCLGEDMKVPPLLMKGTNGVAVVLCTSLALLIIYCACFCLYAAIAVAIDSTGSNASIGQRIADMIRAPFLSCSWAPLVRSKGIPLQVRIFRSLASHWPPPPP